MAISLTPRAAEHVRRNFAQQEAQQPAGQALRLAVRPTGCSGYTYAVEATTDIQPQDAVFECHGVKVVVDPRSLAQLDGTCVDYTREGLREGFRFDNPNVKQTCGCGESFSL
jgi:iron-sulfur cluster assembly protein